MKMLITLLTILIAPSVMAKGFYLHCKTEHVTKLDKYYQPIFNPRADSEKETQYFISADEGKGTIEAQYIFDEIRELTIDKFSINFDVYGKNHCIEFENQIFKTSHPVNTIKLESRYINRITGEYKVYKYSCSDESVEVYLGKCIKFDKPLF